MKKIGYFLILIIGIIIILPMLIVKSHDFAIAGQKTGKTTHESREGTQGQSQIGEEDQSKEEKDKNKIKVYIESEDRIKEMELEEYVVGVVAAEMPAEFAFEALKAQAVAARTYAYGRLKGLYTSKDGKHDGADICTDFTHCQAWISKDEALKKWDARYANTYWEKIEKAVEETKGIIILYKGVIANPVFHSNSGGRTENAEEVWDVGPVDYLKSVVSEGEEASPVFKTITKLSPTEFYSTLKESYPDIKLNKDNIPGDIKILEYTEGERVKRIKVGNIEMKGTDFRKIFSLPSANFELRKDEGGMIEIITYGNGHGVGMSQWGANNLAKNGKNWEEIIKHYYIGVEWSTIDNVESVLTRS